MPMQRQRKQQQKMLAGLQNGNVVVTSGGVVGTIVAIESDDTVVLRVKPMASSSRLRGVRFRVWFRRKARNNFTIDRL